MFTIASTVPCQLPQCKDKWVPVFGEKTGMKVTGYETYGVHRGERRRKSYTKDVDEKIQWHDIVLGIKMEMWGVKSQVFRRGANFCNLRCTSTKHLLKVECHRKAEGR